MKRLVRQPRDQKVTGLCAGIADYTHLDVMVVRLSVLILMIVTNIVLGLLTYLIAAALIPKEGDPT